MREECKPWWPEVVRGSMVLLLLRSGIEVHSHFDAGVGHMACVDEKDARKCKIRRCLINTCI